MNAPATTQWKHLAPNPKSFYKQLFIKGTRIRARILYGMFMSAEEPRTPEQIAEDYGLPLEAVREAIAYCQSNPPEIREDFDPVHLTHAIRSERICLTKNYDDFLVLHVLVKAARGHHPGIFVLRQDNDPTRDLTPRAPFAPFAMSRRREFRSRMSTPFSIIGVQVVGL